MNGQPLSTANRIMHCAGSTPPPTTTSDPGIPASPGFISPGGTQIYVIKVKFPHGGAFTLRCVASIGGEDGPNTNNTFTSAGINVALPAPVICSSTLSGQALTVQGLWLQNLTNGTPPTVTFGSSTLTLNSGSTPYTFSATVPLSELCDTFRTKVINVTNSAGLSRQANVTKQAFNFTMSSTCLGSPITINFSMPNTCPSSPITCKVNSINLPISGLTVSPGTATNLTTGSFTVTLPAQSSLINGTTNKLSVTAGGNTVSQNFFSFTPSVVVTSAGTNSTRITMGVSKQKAGCSGGIQVKLETKLVVGSNVVWNHWKTCTNVTLSTSGSVIQATIPGTPAWPVGATAVRVKVTTDTGTGIKEFDKAMITP